MAQTMVEKIAQRFAVGLEKGKKCTVVILSRFNLLM